MTTMEEGAGGYRIGAKEIDAVLCRDAAVRYDYFVKRVADWEEVWSLRNAGGWVAAATDTGQEVLPFWPFAAFAQRSATGPWADTAPAPIALEAFLARWLPGMAADGRLACVLPTGADRGATVDPLQLKADIEAEQEQLQ
jgi:hypothetical protein